VNTSVKGRCIARLIDAETGAIESEHLAANLVFDSGLNDLTNGRGFAAFFAGCKVGSGGTTPNSWQSGAIQFTQAGNTITVVGVAGFFTGPMIGGVFEWGSGSGGNETYITSVAGGGLSATVSTSATVSVGQAATVWNVQQTGLQNFLYASGTYQTTAVPTAISANTITLARTFVFPVQASPYTVNEIGYANNVAANASCNGRVLITPTITVGTTQFLIVTWTITFSISPSAPAAVADVSGGTFNTAGTAMLNCWDCTCVNSAGSTQNLQNNTASNLFDKSQSIAVILLASSKTLPGAIPTPTLNGSFQCNTNGVETGLYTLGTGSIANSSPGTIVNNLAVVIGTAAFSFSITTAGETTYGLCFGADVGAGKCTDIFYQDFTTPITLPNGTLAGTLTFTNAFGRVLTN